jgi:hypothetical protein
MVEVGGSIGALAKPQRIIDPEIPRTYGRKQQQNNSKQHRMTYPVSLGGRVGGTGTGTGEREGKGVRGERGDRSGLVAASPPQQPTTQSNPKTQTQTETLPLPIER